MKYLLNSAIVFLLGLGLLIAWLAWQAAQYPYNAEGRFFDGTVVHHQQAVMVYALLALCSFGISAFLIFIRKRNAARQNKD